MIETELKFLLDDAAVKAVRARLRALPGLDAAPATRTLRSVYYDTPDHALRGAGIALRMRRDGRRWIQTVKAGSKTHGGLQSAREAEAPAPGGRLDLALIPEPDLRARVEKLTRNAPLQAVCETAIKRLVATALCGDGRVEIALDQGEIIAGEATVPFREVEIELKDGPLGALFDAASALVPEGEVALSQMSKAARGYMLAAEGRIAPPPAPRKARDVALDPAQSVETAARDVLRECFAQVAENAVVCRAIDDPEGPHQLRVGLRRLRSALAVFKPAIGNAEMARLNAEARWLGQEVGVQRDLDVAVIDLLDPEAEAHPDDPGLAVLKSILLERGAENRVHLRAVLRGARAQALLRDLGRFVETRGWLVADDFGQTGRLSAPVAKLARAALDKRWKAVRKKARHIETLDIEARHELRKELKKLRYAVEFFAPILPDKRVKPFVKRLKALQQVFGDLNDAAMAEALFHGADAPGADDPAAQRTIGWLVGTRMERAAHHWQDARALWADLEEAPRPW